MPDEFTETCVCGHQRHDHVRSFHSTFPCALCHCEDHCDDLSDDATATDIELLIERRPGGRAKR